MHWINRPLRRAKVDERLSWWSVGQTCYQVPLSTIDKLVPGTNRVNQVMRRNLYFRRASKHRTNLDLFKLVVAFPVEVLVLRRQQSAFS